MSELALALALMMSPGVRPAQSADADPPAVVAQASTKPQQKPKLDRSGKAKKGKASYYGKGFEGKKMANGERMNPQAAAAASRTLPLGTTARITNLENGKSAEVEIKDRGPYVEGRTVDVTPKVAEDLGMKQDGIARVEVAPIEVPQADGAVMAGEGASATAGSSTSAR